MVRLHRGQIVGGRYRAEELVGSGGTAQVYRVVRTDIDAVRALKLLHHPAPQLEQRFRREGRLLAALTHPHILGVEDLIEFEGLLGLVMPYVEGGRSLDDLILSEKKLDLNRAVVLGDQILSAVAAAHARGIVHRDLKPANVLVEIIEGRDHALVCDFGLAKAIEDSRRRVTRGGEVMGTPPYMAPEQLYGLRDVDHRADVFSLGAMFFELVTGQRAFAGAAVEDIVYAVRNGVRPHVRHLRKDLPAGMTEAIESALSMDPRDRPQSALDLKELWDARDLRHTSIRRPVRQRSAGGSTNVRIPMTRLSGREKELEEAKSCLVEGHRLVTFHGAGGIGKSRLAVELAQQLMRHFTGGIWWVPCSEPGLDLVVHVADAVGSEAMEEEELFRALRDRPPTLIVLDGVESSVTEVERFVHALLAAVRGVACLVTSRIVTGNPRERLFTVGPLDAESALDLIVDRLRSTGMPLEDIEEDRAPYRPVVDAVGGHPLALEFAAEQLRLWPAATVVERAVGATYALGSKRRDRPAGHRSMRAVLNRSWDLLPTETRGVLCQLASFDGSFDFEDIEQIMGDQDLLMVERQLEVLIDHGMVHAYPGERTTRFSLHRTTRDYLHYRSEGAMPMVGRSGERSARHRYLQRVTRSADEIAPGHTLGRQVDPAGIRAVLVAERRRAFDVAVGDGDAEAAARAALATWQVLCSDGPMSLALELAERALALPEVSDERVLQLSRVATAAALSQGRPLDARAHAEVALRHTRGRPSGEQLLVRRDLARVLHRLDEFQAVTENLSQMLQAVLTDPLDPLDAWGQGALSEAAFLADDYGGCRKGMALALKLHEASEDLHGQGSALAVLGAIELVLGTPETVRSTAQTLGAFARSREDCRREGVAEWLLAEAALLEDDVGEALHRVTRARALLEVAGGPGDVMRLCLLESEIALASEEPQRAASMLRASLAQAFSSGETRLEVRMRAFMARACACAGARDEAESMRFSAGAVGSISRLRVACDHAVVAAFFGSPEEVTALLHEAEEIIQKHGAPVDGVLAARVASARRDIARWAS